VDAGNPNFSSEGGILYNKDKTTLRAVPAGLSSVTIPSSVTSIGNWAFGGCRNLTSVTIPAGVTFIGGNAFRACAGLISVTISSSVTKIEWEAFNECSVLTSVTFEAGSAISDFGDNVFPQGYDGWGGNTLKEAYLADGAGTYRRGAGGSIWTNPAKTLAVQGIPQDLMEELFGYIGFIGLFPAGTTVQQALVMGENYWANSEDTGDIVAGSLEAYTDDALTTVYFPLFNINADDLWTGSGSYMIGMMFKPYYWSNTGRVFWTGPVNFSSGAATITFDSDWEIMLP